MISAHDRRGDGFSTPLETPQHLASWYAPGVSDGLGDRLLMFDNTNAPSWELLRFRPEVAAAPGFEIALRERVARLDRFQHPSFPAVRSVEDLGSRSGLALVSTYVPGRRLSDAIERPRSATAAIRLIRQLTPALADLQQQGDTIAHGALTADRIVLMPDGRFMIREHVLGSALQRLRLPASRLWVDLGVVVAPTGDAIPTLDRRTDVIQLGLIALSLMLGRRIALGEYPNKVDDLLEQVARTSCRRSPLAFPPLRHWLERALQVKGRPFESAHDANEAFSDWSDEPQGEDADFELPASHAQDGALQRAAPSAHARVGFLAERAPAPFTSLEQPEPNDRLSADRIDRYAPIPSPPSESSTGALELFPVEDDQSADRPRSRTTRLAATSLADSDRLSERFHTIEALPDVPLDAPRRIAGRSRPLRWFAAASFVLAVGEAVVIAYLLYFRTFPLPAVNTANVALPLPTESGVLAQDQLAGLTSLLRNMVSQAPFVRADSPEASTTPAGAVDQNPPASDDRSATRTTANTRVPGAASGLVRFGSMNLWSAIELRVFERGRLLGSSRAGLIQATAGRHEFDLVNSEIGYHSRHIVDIKAGQTVSLEVTPANGIVSINADPWAEVWIDGNSVGETPLAKLSVPLGEHEFVFRHPELGEQRQRAIVRSDSVTLVNANLRP